MEVEHPVCGGYAAAFHFYPTLPGMLSPTLIGHQIVQMCQPREECLLAAAWMMVTVDGQITLSTSAPKPCVPLLWHTAPQ